MKRVKTVSILVLFFILTPGLYVSAQDTIKTGRTAAIIDSLASKGLIARIPGSAPKIRFQREDAIRYLQSRFISGDWTNPADPFREAIGNLIFYSSVAPLDSLRSFLDKYEYDSLNIPWERFYRWDTLRMKIPVILHPEFSLPQDSSFRADTIGLGETADSILILTPLTEGDSVSFYKPRLQEPTVILRDTVMAVAYDSIRAVLPYKPGNPFWIYRYPWQGDSLAAAVKSLTEYLTERDSSLIKFRGRGGSVVPVWLNSRSGNLERYWLKNDLSDSVTVWIGSTDRNTIGMFLEEGIQFRRPVKQTNISDAQLNLKEINTSSLRDINKIYIKPKYWLVRSEANFVLNQAFATNWVKGGESSLSTAMDITGFADYNNKNLNLVSSNFIRLKYGLVKSEGTTVRKNIDLFETNSKLNHKAFGKFDFSGTVLFKTQISKGYTYSKVNGRDTAALVSRFMNPATLTIGFGLDYKPGKKTSINFAPFSYKATFVPDTLTIDQTKYGVPADRRSMHEPGASLQFTNEYKPFKKITMVNRLQLFTNYIHNPLNIDIDWEMILTANLNWFTDVRFNTHLIYDDDTKTTRLDEDKKPITGPDGKPLKNARAQFKELLGFSFVFRF